MSSVGIVLGLTAALSWGLADYFARLADETPGDDDSDADADDDAGAFAVDRRRLMLPLTPGGRVARSMDERLAWEPIARA